MLDNINYEKNLMQFYNDILICKNYDDIVLSSDNFEKTLDYSNFYPLEFLAQRFNLNILEKACVRLLYLNNLHYIPIKNNEISIEKMISLLKINDKIMGLKLFSKETTLTQMFLIYNGENYNLNTTFTFAPRISDFIFNNILVSPKINEVGELFIPNDKNNNNEEFDNFGEYINKIKSLQGENKAIFIEVNDNMQGLNLVKTYCNSVEKSIIFVDCQLFQSNNADLTDIYCEQIIYDADICLYNLDVFTNEEFYQINKFIKTICEKNKTAFFINNANIALDYEIFNNMSFLQIELPPIDFNQRKNIWKKALETHKITLTTEQINELVGKYSFNNSDIFSVVAYAMANRNNDDVFKQINKICIKRLPQINSNKIIKVNTLYNLKDLILPDYSKNMLVNAINRVKHKEMVYNEWGFSEKLAYGKGVSVVFVGPPGTGKTMGAQVMANEISMELYKVNLAGVVSKYIGETEKNLETIFFEAKKAQGILFFDEADVLFSKRTEIKDSNDKYSNMEAAFMLQKIEEFDGICILATNFIQNFDEAFKRRMNYIIDFPFPNEEYRKLLWENVFPKKVPLSSDLDFGFLAKKFEFTGSNIKNSAITAAFYAATENKKIDMTILLKAIKNEMHKIGKSMSKENLYEYSDLWNEISI